jgi:hypothetical protein
VELWLTVVQQKSFNTIPHNFEKCCNSFFCIFVFLYHYSRAQFFFWGELQHPGKTMAFDFGKSKAGFGITMSHLKQNLSQTFQK